MKGGKKQYERDEYIDDDYVPPRNAKGAMRSGPPRLAVWEQGSRDTVEEQQFNETKRKAAEYNFSRPWDQESHDAADELQRHVEALDYEIVPPWGYRPGEQGGDDGDAELNRKLHAISSYEYEPLWKPVEQTVQRKEQIANYKIEPPFNTMLTEVTANNKPAKKPIAGYNPKTLAPWQHGSQPAPSAPAKVQFDMPPTGFWPAPQQAPETLLDSSGDPVLDSLRMQLKKHGANGILGLARKFRIMDDDGSGTLDIDEFSKAMRECNVCDLSKMAIDHLFRYFDADDSGTVSYDDFLVGVRGVMNPRRRGLVQLAFNILDKDKSGELDLDDIRDVYDATNHPDVIAGKKTVDQVLTEFLMNFEGSGGNKDGIVTGQEFESYYANISASLDDDDYFELMIRNAWHISGGKGAYANSTNRRVLVTHEDGRQTVEEIENDISMRRDDTAGMMNRLKSQGVSAVKINTNGATDSTQGRGGRGGPGGLGGGGGGAPQPQSLQQQNGRQQQQVYQQQIQGRQQAQGRAVQPQYQGMQPQNRPQTLQQQQQQPQQLYQQQRQQQQGVGRQSGQAYQQAYQPPSRGSNSNNSVSSQGSGRIRPKSLSEHLQC